jgi:hypothetical protein
MKPSAGMNGTLQGLESRAPQMMSDGGRQVRLTKSDATVNEERVVFLARPLGYRQRGRLLTTIFTPSERSRR